MRGSLEERYIHNLDQPKSDSERKGQGFPAEEVVVNFFNSSGFETRFSTPREDEGRQDIGPKQIIDAVAYRENKPAMGLQITTSASRGVREKKLDEMRNKPFFRLGEMSRNDAAIPRVLIYLDAKQVSDFSKEPDFSHHPEIALQIINSVLRSLMFDLTKTKNPLEQKAAQDLIKMLEQEKKKYVH